MHNFLFNINYAFYKLINNYYISFKCTIYEKTSFFFVLLFVGLISNSFCQNSDSSFGDHLRYGGSFNVGFSNNYTTIGISPSVIYAFDNGFSTGLSLSYFYTKNKTINNTFSSNVYGGSIIGLYNTLSFLQLSVELEELNINYTDRYFDYDSYWNTALYLGLAYRSRNVSIGFRYDVLYDNQKSIYGSSISPVFRIYF